MLLAGAEPSGEMGSDPLGQVRGRNRFEQVIPGPRFERLDGILHGPIGRQNQNNGFRGLPMNERHQIYATAIGHADIGDHHGVTDKLQLFPCLEKPGGAIHLKGGLTEGLAEGEIQVVVIINDQDVELFHGRIVSYGARYAAG